MQLLTCKSWVPRYASSWREAWFATTSAHTHTISSAIEPSVAKTRLCGNQGRYGRPARTYLRLAEAGGRPELDLALAGRAGAPEEGELVEASGRLVSTYACAAALECGQRAEAAGQDGV